MAVRVCSECGVEKPLEEFYKQPYRAGSGKYGRRGKCKACFVKKQQNYNSKHKEHKAEYDLDYRRVNRERRAESWRAYYQTERGKKVCRRRNRARRAREVGSPGFYDEAAVWSAYDNKCALCGASGVPMTEGHIIPLSRGGSNWAFNIRPECMRCNRSKHARLDEELPASFWSSRPDGTAWPGQAFV